MERITLDYIGGKKGKKWAVASAIIHELSNGEVITIAEGFETDLSSVPKILWGIFPPYGNFLLAALVHDYLYVTKYKDDRAFADKEMLIVSNKIHNNKIDNYLSYYAVVLFGWVVWDK